VGLTNIQGFGTPVQDAVITKPIIGKVGTDENKNGSLRFITDALSVEGFGVNSDSRSGIVGILHFTTYVIKLLLPLSALRRSDIGEESR
jgi:hypothetical protein